MWTAMGSLCLINERRLQSAPHLRGLPHTRDGADMAIVAGEDLPDDLACLTCAHVLAGSPIQLVARDDDGGWQFLCSRLHSAADARVIGLGEAVAIESNLSTIAPLQVGRSILLPA